MSTRLRYLSSHATFLLSRIQSLSRVYFPPRALIFFSRVTSPVDLKAMFKDKRNSMMLGDVGEDESTGITRMLRLSFRPLPIYTLPSLTMMFLVPLRR